MCIVSISETELFCDWMQLLKILICFNEILTMKSFQFSKK